MDSWFPRRDTIQLLLNGVSVEELVERAEQLAAIQELLVRVALSVYIEMEVTLFRAVA